MAKKTASETHRGTVINAPAFVSAPKKPRKARRDEYEIEGLKMVRAPEPAREGPGKLSEDEIEAAVRPSGGPAVRNYRGPQRDLKFAFHILKQIQSHLQFFAERNRNDKLVGIDDFNIALVMDGKRKPVFGVVDDGDGLLFVGKKNGKALHVDAVPPGGFTNQSYHSTTATLLIRTAR